MCLDGAAELHLPKYYSTATPLDGGRGAPGYTLTSAHEQCVLKTAQKGYLHAYIPFYICFQATLHPQPKKHLLNPLVSGYSVIKR